MEERERPARVSCEVWMRPQVRAGEKDSTPVVADVGGFRDESGIDFEMEGNHDEYFRRNPADYGVVAVETSADNC